MVAEWRSSILKQCNEGVRVAEPGELPKPIGHQGLAKAARKEGGLAKACKAAALRKAAGN